MKKNISSTISRSTWLNIPLFSLFNSFLARSRKHPPHPYCFLFSDTVVFIWFATKNPIPSHLSISNTSGRMPIDRTSHLTVQKHDPNRRQRSFCHSFAHFLCSNVGLILIIVAYSIGGAYLFILLEQYVELQKCQQANRKCDHSSGVHFGFSFAQCKRTFRSRIYRRQCSIPSLSPVERRMLSIHKWLILWPTSSATSLHEKVIIVIQVKIVPLHPAGLSHRHCCSPSRLSPPLATDTSHLSPGRSSSLKMQN